MFVAALPYLFKGASLLGGILGHKKRKVVDPEFLRQHFGAKAQADRTAEMTNYILNSPYGQQLLESAAAQGSQLQNDMAARAAASGLSPDTGGQSAASDFAVAGGASAGQALGRGVRSSVTQAAMPLAADQIAQERDLYLQNIAAENAQPSRWQQIGQVASGVAAMLPSSPQQQPGAIDKTPSVTPPSVAAGPSGPSQFQVPEVQRPSALSSVIAPTFGAREASAMNPFQRNVMPKRKGLRLSAMYNPYVQGGLR